ncbi:unnamed protein product [Mytilus edulis]|uniref:Uncharacterized protein n=1 Tax=Mytilus edulis TaxID=6550 RepID=A0A8S3SMW5_MYTED|nr:unnamed protein product [Mytilus edulis]
MPLPFKDKNPPILTNNKNIAVTRLNQLRGRLQRDKTYRYHYFTSMNDFIEKGYVEKEHGNPIEYHDGLKSVTSIDDAVNLVKRSREMCNKVGLKLHKFQSNSKELLNLIPIEDRAKDLKNLDLLNDKLPITKTLGIQWCIESDSFQFRIELTNKPLTGRGILSTLSSMYEFFLLSYFWVNRFYKNVVAIKLIGTNRLLKFC